MEAHFNTREEESKTYDSGLPLGTFVFLLSFPVLVVPSVLPLGIIPNLAKSLWVKGRAGFNVTFFPYSLERELFRESGVIAPREAVFHSSIW